MSYMEVTFPGGLKSRVDFDGFTLYTDQPEDSGGGGAHPNPFSMFFASLATCTGVTALNFCQAREIDTSGLKVRLDHDWDSDKDMVTKIHMEVVLPEGFPEKYKKAIMKAVDLCTVKQHIEKSPAIETTLV